MHEQAYNFVRQFATDQSISVVEIGSRNINGTVRGLFPASRWVGIDLHPGPDVDIVGDMLDFTPEDTVDMVVCCEVLEHAEKWREMIARASDWLKWNGSIIITCAGPGRLPHSHIDGCQLRPGEYYGNVTTQELRTELEAHGLRVVICCQVGNDTQAMAMLI